MPGQGIRLSEGVPSCKALRHKDLRARGPCNSLSHRGLGLLLGDFCHVANIFAHSFFQLADFHIAKETWRIQDIFHISLYLAIFAHFRICRTKVSARSKADQEIDSKRDKDNFLFDCFDDVGWFFHGWFFVGVENDSVD